MEVSEAGIERAVSAARAGARVIGVSRLEGGSSAQARRIDVRLPHGDATWVLRIHSEIDRRRDPHIARHEFDLLSVLAGSGIPAPRPVAWLPDAFDVPCILLEYLAGDVMSRVPGEELVRDMIETLGRIHDVDTVLLDFLPTPSEWVARMVDYAGQLTDPATARLAGLVRETWPASPPAHPVLLHGDYWPGNLLVQQDRLAGVIDWEDAALGDPLWDLSVLRLDMLWKFGPDAMEHVTRCYRERRGDVGVGALATSDLAVALRGALGMLNWGVDDAAPEVMRARHEVFTTRARAALGL
ncbi:MAG: phosphotransferase [Pseudomonadales bacterium]|nr:phosphotransferase [Pseudomonadales bacterium]